MATLNINKSSFLNFSRLLDYEGVLFWDETTLPDIPVTDGDTYVQVTSYYAKRLDLLAYDTYGDPELMWAILLANKLDLPNQVYEGLLIRLPAKGTIDLLLEQAVV